MTKVLCHDIIGYSSPTTTVMIGMCSNSFQEVYEYFGAK